jgi:hypothetical protein
LPTPGKHLILREDLYFPISWYSIADTPTRNTTNQAKVLPPKATPESHEIEAFDGVHILQGKAIEMPDTPCSLASSPEGPMLPKMPCPAPTEKGGNPGFAPANKHTHSNFVSAITF